MKVAWLGHLEGERSDGLSTYSREAREQLARRGVDVLFFHYEEPGMQPASLVMPRGFRFKTMRVPSLGSSAFIAEHLRRFKADLVHVSMSFSLIEWRVHEIAHSMGLPAVATFHVPYDRRPGLRNYVLNMVTKAYAPALSHYDKVIIFSEGHRAQLAGVGVDPKVLAVIPNGVDVERYHPGPSLFRQGAGVGFLATYMGRLDPEKNCEVLCDAWADLDLGDGNLLMLMGQGTERRRLLRRFGKHPQIRLPGLIRSEAERIDILRGSDIFILPSSIEGLSLSLLEAMACGCCTLATDVGSDGEVTRGVGITLNPLALRPQLELAIRLCQEQPQLRQHLGRLARARVLQRYNLKDNFNQLLDLYERLLGPAPPGSDDAPR